MNSAPSIPDANTGDIERNKDLAAFSYILIFSPILLITRRDSEFIRHHSLQALYLAFFAIGFMMLPGRLSYLNIIVVGGALMGFLEAQSGNWYKMPIISDLIVRKVTLQRIWTWIKNFALYLGNIFQRMFTEGPGFAIRGTYSAVQKARGIDAMKVNAKVEALTKELHALKAQIEQMNSANTTTAYTSPEYETPEVSQTDQSPNAEVNTMENPTPPEFAHDEYPPEPPRS